MEKELSAWLGWGEEENGGEENQMAWGCALETEPEVLPVGWNMGEGRMKGCIYCCCSGPWIHSV